MASSNETLALQPDSSVISGNSIRRNLTEIDSLIDDVTTSPSESTNETTLSLEPEASPEVLAQEFASRVDKLIEQVGGTTAKIGDATYHFTNGGTTVNVEQSGFFKTDSHTYPYTEEVTAVHPPEGGPVMFRGEHSVKNPAFGQSASWELSLHQADLRQRMDEMINTVERYVLQRVHLGNVQPLNFPTPIKSAA